MLLEPEMVAATSTLGELRALRRAGSGVPLDEIGARCDLEADRISSVEAGRHDLSDGELRRVLKAQPRFLQPGDSVEVSIDGVGTLSNPVVA